MASTSETARKIEADEGDFPTDWDLDAYHTEHETEEHWSLRRQFMKAHKNKFSEDRLVCLAQVFTNVEFMGCKYPDEVMRLVGELSQDVAKEFRAERAKKLKRTFVAASDAAESRAKGWKSGPQKQLDGQQGSVDDNIPSGSGSSTSFESKRMRLDTGARQHPYQQRPQYQQQYHQQYQQRQHHQQYQPRQYHPRPHHQQQPRNQYQQHHQYQQQQQYQRQQPHQYQRHQQQQYQQQYQHQ